MLIHRPVRSSSWKNRRPARVRNRSRLEFPILVSPFLLRHHGFDDIPVLGEFPVLDPEEVLIRDGLRSKGSLTCRQNKVALPENHPGPVKMDGHPPCGEVPECGREPRHPVRNERVVLDVRVPFEERRQSFRMLTHQHGGREIPDTRLVLCSLIEVTDLRRTIGHAMSVPGLSRRLLQVVPVLDNPAVFEPEDVEPRLVLSGEEILRMKDNILAVAEDSDGPYGRTGLPESGERVENRFAAVGKREVVLDVGVQADVLLQRGPVSALESFENGDRFVFVCRFRGVHAGSRVSGCGNKDDPGEAMTITPIGTTTYRFFRQPVVSLFDVALSRPASPFHVAAPRPQTTHRPMRGGP